MLFLYLNKHGYIKETSRCTQVFPRKLLQATDMLGLRSMFTRSAAGGSVTEKAEKHRVKQWQEHQTRSLSSWRLESSRRQTWKPTAEGGCFSGSDSTCYKERLGTNEGEPSSVGGKRVPVKKSLRRWTWSRFLNKDMAFGGDNRVHSMVSL